MATSVAPAALHDIYRLIKPHLPSREISGIINDGNNSGYHPSRNVLIAKGRSNDYSLQAPADLRGDANLASAIDIKFNDAEMRLVSSRLRAACTPDAEGDYDPRIECIREFIGTVNGHDVCGYNRFRTGRPVGWYPSGYSDASHLWHVHISIFRDRPGDTVAMIGLAEVIAGLSAGALGWVPQGNMVAPSAPVAWDGASFPGITAFVLGQSHPAVTLLGERLVAHGWTGYAEGPGPVFTEVDLAAVKAFQEAQGWTGANADGFPGPTTWALLMADPPAPTGPSSPEHTPALPEEPSGVNFRAATINTRRSTIEEEVELHEWEHRAAKFVEFMRNVPGGVPGLVLFQELTKEQQQFLQDHLAMTIVGNGLNGHPGDVAGDNVAVGLSSDWTIRRVVSVKSRATGSAARHITWVLAKRAGQSLWAGSTHLTQGSGNGPLRKQEITDLINESLEAGVSMAIAVLGGDFNEGTANNVRAVIRSHGLVDAKSVMSAEDQSIDTFTGFDTELEFGGRHIDSIFCGSEITIRKARLVRVLHLRTDHHLVMAHGTLEMD